MTSVDRSDFSFETHKKVYIFLVCVWLHVNPGQLNQNPGARDAMPQSGTIPVKTGWLEYMHHHHHFTSFVLKVLHHVYKRKTKTCKK